MVEIYLVSDLMNDERLQLEYSIVDFTAKLQRKNSIDVVLKASSSQIYVQIPIKELDTINQVLVVNLKDEEGNIVQSENCFLAAPKYLNLQKAMLNYEIERNNDHYELIFQTEELQKNVVLDFPENPGFVLSENNFDLLPKQIKRIRLNISQVQVGEVQVRSLNQLIAK
jgi:hypothetical protein